jgi:hypothetical protein
MINLYSENFRETRCSQLYVVGVVPNLYLYTDQSVQCRCLFLLNSRKKKLGIKTVIRKKK